MSHIYRWFMQDVSHLRMGAARIFLGFCLLGAYLVRAPYAGFLYGPHGFAGIDYFEISAPQMQYSFGLGKWLIFLFPEPFFYALYALILISAFCFMIGFRTRFFGIILLLLHVTFDQRNFMATAGWAKLAHCFLFYVVLSRGGDVWSVDGWLNKKRLGLKEPLPVIAPMWPIRLMQIHICTMYFVSSWPRMWQEMWTKGYAVLYTFLHQEYSRLGGNFFEIEAALKTVDWMALTIEPFAFVAVWLPFIGPFWVVALCMMHMTLEITTHVDWWNFMMLGGLMSFFPDEWLRFSLKGGINETQTPS